VNELNDLAQTKGRVWRLYAACIAGAAVLAALIYAGHGPHVLQLLPLLLIAACPLMHFFMHGRHKHRNDHSR
jgi:Flp pilus assembly protein TadB